MKRIVALAIYTDGLAYMKHSFLLDGCPRWRRHFVEGFLDYAGYVADFFGTYHPRKKTGGRGGRLSRKSSPVIESLLKYGAQSRKGPFLVTPKIDEYGHDIHTRNIIAEYEFHGCVDGRK